MTCLRSEMGLGGFVLRDLLTRVSFWGQWIHPPIFNLWNLFSKCSPGALHLCSVVIHRILMTVLSSCSRFLSGSLERKNRGCAFLKSEWFCKPCCCFVACW